MLYPEITNFKKTNRILKWLIFLSILVSAVCVLINSLCTKQIHWSILCVGGVIYILITTLYSVKKNVNIASHIMVQMICACILLVVIDYSVGYKGWSLNFGIPIAIEAANIAIFVLTIISHKKYFQYVIYQLIIFAISLVPVVLYFMHITTDWLAMTISTGIAVVTLLLTVILCGKDVKEEIQRAFHI